MTVVPKSAFHTIQIDDDTVLVLVNYPTKVYLSGILMVKSIRGSLQILGYALTPKKSPIPVYSIKEYNTLEVVPLNDGKLENDVLYLNSLRIPKEKVDEIMRNSLCYSHSFIVSRSDESYSFISFFKRYNLPLFLNENIDDGVKTSVSSDENIIREDPEWIELSEKLSSEPKKVLICGGKNVGKSTLLRYLVNRHLEKRSSVLVLDLDPGQSEFTMMGCISAVLVKKPLVGPNFTHILTPEKNFYLGEISMDMCITLYPESIEKLVSFCDSPKYKNIPWIVNTMGFSKGLGIKFLGRIIDVIKPTDIIQINSKRSQNNFPAPLTVAFFQQQNENFYWDLWNYNLYTLSSMADNVQEECTSASRETLKPATKRDIVIMSYFKKTLPSTSTNLLSIVPQKISIDEVEIIIAKPTSKEIDLEMTVAQKLCCINANLVALCIRDSSGGVNCLGFGIIRGIDIENECLYIITPLCKEELTKVTIIKMSSTIQLPEVVYENQKSQKDGPCPYVNYKIPNKLNQPIRKTSSRVKPTQDSHNFVENFEHSKISALS